MSFLLYLFYGIVGYVVGFGIRRFFAKMNWGKPSCNIKRTGVTGRALGAIVLAVMSTYLQMPFLMICTGFVIYESRARWCVVRSFQ